jgi:integrase
MYRKARGFKEETHLRNLIRFDKFCAEHYPQTDELTSEIVYAWLDTETAVNAWALPERATTIRQFGVYLNAVDEEAYVLPDKFATNRSSFVPFILTDNELSALFKAIDNLPNRKSEPFLNVIAPVLFRLIYTCGLRPNEGRCLLSENINLDTGEIAIINTKHNKDRIVVMSDDMRKMCRKYNAQRGIFGAQSPYFFPAQNGEAFKDSKIYAAFNKAWVTATCSPQNPIPRRIRVYDLRHRFASACLNRWLDEGRNLMTMLPYLREYMGHDKMNETAYYIHILPEHLVKSPAIDWKKFNDMFSGVSV